MKYNSQLNLIEYIQVVNSIEQDYFDDNTYEYTPHIGEIHAVCEYYNNCAEPEEADEFPNQPVTDITEMEKLYNNKDFMKHFYDEINNPDVNNASFTFGHAYKQAMDIVNYKKSDANSFATAISASMDSILKSFRDSFSDKEIQTFTNIAKDITSGKLSSESIVKAYENSARFATNTQEVNNAKADIISFADNN